MLRKIPSTQALYHLYPASQTPMGTQRMSCCGDGAWEMEQGSHVNAHSWVLAQHAMPRGNGHRCFAWDSGNTFLECSLVFPFVVDLICGGGWVHSLI